jgi:hypothetical protein
LAAQRECGLVTERALGGRSASAVVVSAAKRLVTHITTPDALGREGTSSYLGHMFVEPRRHAPGLAGLTDTEAQSVGLWSARASRALREVAGAEHVYAAVIGDGVPIFTCT